ncbi:hypothetical protein Acr_29g0005850 [Actinidia rufa]|uniref:Retrotransposon Copia-like N-terminal domain-containing protein n=1 Tax=Actinidia rufa TaxID=165716 RepID=A0A7J0HE87_9ERIC|nr:hypothetical protein Acr_29g0005850 [Actinidia rufa]
MNHAFEACEEMGSSFFCPKPRRLAVLNAGDNDPIRPLRWHLIVMDRSEVSRPIVITLEGPNYIPWSQAMSSFLKERKLWRYVTGDIESPVQGVAETPTEYIECLEEWNSKNHQIITWIRNTSIPSISLQFERFDTAYAIWNFLATRYTTANRACQYQLLTSLCRQRQEPGQSISVYLSQIYSIWDQLTLFEPEWVSAADAALFAIYRDQQRLILFLMGLSDARLGLIPTSYVDTALVVPSFRACGSSSGSRGSSTFSAQSSVSISRHNECTFCHATDHRLLTCPVRVCKHCRQRCPRHYLSDCPKVPTRRDIRPQSTTATAQASYTASAFSTLIDVSDLPALVQQILSTSTNLSTALFAPSGSADGSDFLDRP